MFGIERYRIFVIWRRLYLGRLGCLDTRFLTRRRRRWARLRLVAGKPRKMGPKIACGKRVDNLDGIGR